MWGYPLALLVGAGLLYANAQREAPDFDSYELAVFAAGQESDFERGHELVDEIVEHFPGEVRGPLLRGWLLECEERLEEAASTYEACISLARSSAEAADILASAADIQRRLDQPERAAALISEARAQHTDTPRLGRVEVSLLLETRKPKEALSVTKSLAERWPEDHSLGQLLKQIEREVASHESELVAEDATSESSP